MTLTMAYVVLVSAGLAALAATIEALLRARRAKGRWTWVVALGAVPFITAFVMVAPRPDTPIAAARAMLATLPATGAATPQVADAPVSLLAATDGLLTAAWLVLTGLLLLSLALGQWRLVHERRRAVRHDLLGHDVLVTDHLGPAVAGLARPVVFLPRWVLALDHESQRLLLAHELEHVERRDTMLLFSGALLNALVPWNPVVWWMTRRLRLAVEQDCDDRVLAAQPGVRRYVDLLLMAASRPRLSTRLLAAHLGEHVTDLQRRIEAMTQRRMNWRLMLATGCTGLVLIAVACATERPDPVAPVALVARAPAGLVAVSEAECDVSQGIHVQAADLVLTSRRLPLDQSRARTAEVPVEQLEVRAAPLTAYPRRVTARTIQSGCDVGEAKAVPSRPHVAVRPQAAATAPPNIVVLTMEGRELRRFVAKAGQTGARSMLGDIKPEDIGAVEVYYGAACRTAGADIRPEVVGCPLIRVLIKPGREGAYRNR